MPRFSIADKEIATDSLSGRLVVTLDGQAGDILSFDVYGEPPAEPEGHLGYWCFEVRELLDRAELEFDLSTVSPWSARPSDHQTGLRRESCWITPRFEREDGRLIAKCVHWRQDTMLDEEILLLPVSPDALAACREGVSRQPVLESHPVYLDSQCAPESVSPPNLLLLETSARCNLKCTMCPRTLEHSPTGGADKDFDLAMLEPLQYAIEHSDAVCMSLFGEPFLNPRFFDIAQGIKKRNPRAFVSATTNGTLLRPETIRKIIDIDLGGIAVSIDAADPDLYAKIRKGATLDKVLAGIDALNAAKKAAGPDRRTPHLSIGFVAMTENFEEFPKIVELAAKHDVPFVSISPVDDFSLTDTYGLKDGASMGERREHLRQVFLKGLEKGAELEVEIAPSLVVRLVHEIGVPSEDFKEFDIDPALFDNSLTAEQTAERRWFKDCKVPFIHAFVSAEGNVHPCCVSSRVMGNVRDRDFESIWLGETYTWFRRKLRTSDPPPECRACRRVHWQEMTPLFRLRPDLVVQKSESLGPGFTSLETRWGEPTRRVSRDFVFYLWGSGEPYLNVAGFNRSSELYEADIAINGRPAGRLKLGPGWDRTAARLTEAPEGVCAVRIASRSPRTFLYLRSAAFSDTPEASWRNRLLAPVPSRLFNPLGRFLAPHLQRISTND